MQNFIDKNYLYAIVGASQNKNKYGYKVLMDLRQKGFNAVPINPKYETIDGIKCYPSLLDLEDRPDVVVIITNPKVSLKIVEECSNLDLNQIWFQPGAADAEVLDLAQAKNIDYQADKCIMEETK